MLYLHEHLLLSKKTTTEPPISLMNWINWQINLHFRFMTEIHELFIKKKIKKRGNFTNNVIVRINLL